MSDLQIENIIKGIASGKYVREVGSQFGSIWGFDGLLVAEATAEQYAEFGAAPDIKLCHSQDINWLGQKWSVILAYRRQSLAQVSAYAAAYDDQIVGRTVTWLTSLLGKPKESSAEFSWVGRDGLVTLTRTPEFLQVDVRQFWLLERLLAKLRSLI
jgi:hypothetical protein